MQSLINKDISYQQFTEIFYKTSDYRIAVDNPFLKKLLLLSRHLQMAIEDNSNNSDNDILSYSLLSIILVILNRRSADNNIPSTTSPSEQSMPAVIKSIFQYVDDNIHNKISVPDIASTVHLNPVYLTRMFHQYTGLSIQQYIIEKRLTEAKRLLKKGNSPTDVCFECGFNNYSNFSRTFSKHVKISPRQFQENSRAYYEPYPAKSK